MSEVQKNIIGRRTVYRFIEKKIKKEILDNAFEAARFAPSHKNTNPWRFAWKYCSPWRKRMLYSKTTSKNN